MELSTVVELIAYHEKRCFELKKEPFRFVFKDHGKEQMYLNLPPKLKETWSIEEFQKVLDDIKNEYSAARAKIEERNKAIERLENILADLRKQEKLLENQMKESAKAHFKEGLEEQAESKKQKKN